MDYNDIFWLNQSVLLAVNYAKGKQESQRSRNTAAEQKETKKNKTNG